MSLQQLLYISDVVHPMTGGDLQKLLDVARPMNRDAGITGVLFYNAGHFVQFIEGPGVEVERLLDRIRRDRRHQHLRVLLRHATHQRLFEQWDMALLDLDYVGEEDRRRLHRLIQLAGRGARVEHGTPMELALLAEFSPLLSSTAA